jgi:phosphoribosylformimino-5-aminoimidazole carboxamide ribotide isomerase
MIVIPAIDLKDGKCVRLTQGRADQETVYDADPVSVARDFARAGARMLHLVDLDGAFRGKTANLAAIEAVVRAVEIPVELGGGMRGMADIDGMLALGLDSVIVGTMAVKDPDMLEEVLVRFGGDRVQLGVDARDGKVAVNGWTGGTGLEAVAFAKRWKALGVRRVIFTDIARDGMLEGPNVEAIRRFAAGTGLRVTASGGVSNAEDLVRLAGLESIGVDRAIVGKALYEGRVSLADALRLVQPHPVMPSA